MTEGDGSAAEDVGVIGVGELGDGRMFDEDRATQRGERGVGEIDDDDLGCNEETSELVDGHRLRATAPAAFGLGD